MRFSFFRAILISALTAIFLSGCAPSSSDDYEANMKSIEAEPTLILSRPSGGVLDWSSFTYLGAFRMPEDGIDESQMFSYSGEAMTYCAGHDSLFVTGHDWYTYVAEISIPDPLLAKNASELPAVDIIQPLADIRGGLFDRWTLEMPRVGLEALGGELYFCWGEHMQDDMPFGTHGVTGLDLLGPTAKAVCRVGGSAENYATNDYIFEIPKQWADEFAPGCDLATGRFRDGGWSGMGPSLFAVKSEDIKNADMDASIDALTLIRYDSSYDGDAGAALTGYSHADSWSGGAWITSQSGSAVVFAGTHGYGHTWYGFANGVEYPTSGDESEAVPDVPDWPYDQRGWWNDDFRACMLFYDPARLADAVSGALSPNEVQPCGMIDLSPYMIGQRDETDMQYIGGVAYDRAGGRLFIQELFADQDRPVIHVFSVG